MFFKRLNVKCQTPKVRAFAVILLSLTLLIPPFSIAQADIYVPGNEINGVTWTTPITGIYRFTITGGAFSPWGCDAQFPEPYCGDPGSKVCWGWHVGIYGCIDRSPWSNCLPEDCPFEGPAFDFAFGDGCYWMTLQKAEAASIGMFTDVNLDAGQIVILLAPDHKGYYTANRGGMYVSVEKLSEPGQPIASFSYSPENPMVGGNIIFNASGSNDPDGNIVSYQWDWGDGTSDPPRPIPNIMHMFTTPSIYTVTLIVTDNDGLTNTKSIEINLTLENGDLLLCRDFASLVPDYWSFWSHIGIYDKTSNTVIESRPIEGGVWPYPLSDWFFPSKTYVKALRINTSQAVKNAAVAFASAQTDSWSPYDAFSLLVPFPLLGMKNQDNSDGLGWYCSELVWGAYLWGSNGSVNLDMDAFAVSPQEIADSSWIEKVVGEHMETEPPETVYQGGGILFGQALCPVDLVINDPDGLVLSKSVNAISGAIYKELDFDHDGDLDDAFMIPKRKMGGYSIEVTPEPNAMPTDTYSLEVVINGQTMVLAQDVQIQGIPAEPYQIESKLNQSDFDSDGDVDFADYTIFASQWMSVACNYPNWCQGTDLDYSGFIDVNDLDIFVEDWLWEKIPADIDIDGDVDFADYTVLAKQWLQPPGLPSADIAPEIKDGIVNILDLAELITHWLEGSVP